MRFHQDFRNSATRVSKTLCDYRLIVASVIAGDCFAESHAAAVKHDVITIEKAMGMIKRYLQLTTVMAEKQRANAHAVPRMSAKVAAGRPASCHANIAANR